MPLVSPFPNAPLVDGRQSDRAMMVRRGVQRLMIAHRVSLLPEMPLQSGRRADLVCMSDKGEISIVEIKTSIEDFRVDRKWPDYLQHCDRLFFATHPGVPADIFPDDQGLIVSDGYTAEILREAPVEKMSAATRKAMTLRFARLSADRLLQAEWAANPFMTD
ncbi:DNA repair protein MmcB-related protein [Fulvimarina endophytica]|uniref:DNA repair protein MmcB-related protein n=1 Tax=Fulvimarina endophytica TaxID=2293836 RepID=A0A371X8B8_9HYPH|nr:MmcB family DNA repair protein [Fulvimarina endophytica]RFC65440.1 DNA repair protein MmcB-related protein [Fulvimarina endophytica]